MATANPQKRPRATDDNASQRPRKRQWDERHLEIIAYGENLHKILFKGSSLREIIIIDDDDSEKAPLPPRKILVYGASPREVIIVIDDDGDSGDNKALSPPYEVIVNDASLREIIIIDDDDDETAPLPPRKILVQGVSPRQVIIVVDDGNDDEKNKHTTSPRRKVRFKNTPEVIIIDDKAPLVDTIAEKDACEVIVENRISSSPDEIILQPDTAPGAFAVETRQRSSPLREAITNAIDTRHQSAPILATQLQGGRLVVVMGAGISTQAGLPNFLARKELQPIFNADRLRSPETVQMYLDESRTFQEIANIASPTLTHKFISRLRSSGKLLRAYTQNIDGLEEKAGLTSGFDAPAVCIQLHGDIHSLRCSLCLYWPPPGDIAPGSECPNCQGRAKAKKEKGNQSLPIGTLIPDIRLYNKRHPDDWISGQVRDDLKQQPDVLLVLGTSLRVPGVRELVKVIGSAVRMNGGRVLFVNRTPPPEAFRDLFEWFPMDCDEWVQRQIETGFDKDV